jgi:Protein of unknown function (DUF3486)
MGQRSKVVTQLPEDLRGQLDQLLVKGSFTDYRGLSGWLAERGFNVSHGSLQRYGSAFEKRIKTIAIATRQAHALAEASPDREGAMTDALVRLVQEKIFAVLVEAEDIEEGHLTKIARAIADLGRATISQKRWAEEMRARLEKQKRDADQTLKEIKGGGGLSDDAYERTRALLLNIDPLSTREQTSGDSGPDSGFIR